LTAINAVVPSKGGLTSLAFNRDSQQINSVIIVKYKCLPAQSARQSKGTSFVIGLGRHWLSQRPKNINTDQGRGLAKTMAEQTGIKNGVAAKLGGPQPTN
jgi:hypothetical protein